MSEAYVFGFEHPDVDLSDGYADILGAPFTVGPGLWFVRFRIVFTSAITIADIIVGAPTVEFGGFQRLRGNTIAVDGNGAYYVEVAGVVDGYETPDITLWGSADGTSGGGYVDIAPFDSGLSAAHARFDNVVTGTTTQAISASTDTVMAFGHNVATHPYVTRATDGAGHKFTINRGGIWTTTVTGRFVGGTAGERYMALLSDTYGSLAVLTADGGSANASTPETMSISFTDYIGAGKIIKAQAWQTGNATLNLDGSGIWKNITFALVAADPDIFYQVS